MQRITVGQIDFEHYYEYADTFEEFLEQLEEEIEEGNEQLRKVCKSMEWNEFLVFSELMYDWSFGKF